MLCQCVYSLGQQCGKVCLPFHQEHFTTEVCCTKIESSHAIMSISSFLVKECRIFSVNSGRYSDITNIQRIQLIKGHRNLLTSFYNFSYTGVFSEKCSIFLIEQGYPRVSFEIRMQSFLEKSIKYKECVLLVQSFHASLFALSCFKTKFIICGLFHIDFCFGIIQ